MSVGTSRREIAGIGLKGMEEGWTRGDVVFIDGSVSFLGDVDPENGILTKGDVTHKITDRILVFAEGSGSTVGSYVIYNLKLNGLAPRGVIMHKADAIISIGCIVASIPLVHRIGMDELREIGRADRVEMNPSLGLVRIDIENEER